MWSWLFSDECLCFTVMILYLYFVLWGALVVKFFHINPVWSSVRSSVGTGSSDFFLGLVWLKKTKVGQRWGKRWQRWRNRDRSQFLQLSDLPKWITCPVGAAVERAALLTLHKPIICHLWIQWRKSQCNCSICRETHSSFNRNYWIIVYIPIMCAFTKLCDYI